MGIYAEKRDKLVARIEELTKRIATDTAKKQELDHIMNVEIPENSKEIGIARALYTNPSVLMFDAPSGGMRPFLLCTKLVHIAHQREARLSIA